MTDPTSTPTAPPAPSRGYRWLKRLGQGGALVFVLWTAWAIQQRWSGLPASLPVAPIALAGGALALANLVAGQTWRLLLRGLCDAQFSRLWLLQVFLSSQLARYTPGKIGLPALRVGALGAHGVAPSPVLASTLLEVGSWGLTSAAVSSLVLALVRPPWLEVYLLEHLGLSAPSASAVFAAGTLVCLAVSRLQIRRLPPALRNRLGGSGSAPLIPFAVVALHTIFWLLWLLHGWLLLWALGQPDLGSATGFIVAPVVGFVALFAPAGAGVREAVLITALSPAVGWSHATAAGLLSRALSLGADVGSWALVTAWARRKGADAGGRSNS